MAPQTPNARQSRRRAALLVVAAIAGFVLIAGAVVLATRASKDAEERAGKGSYRGSEPPGRNVLPAFELASYRGGRVTSQALRGRVVLLTLLDSQCTEACPILASMIAGAVDRLTPVERTQVSAVAISGDPAEDTPASVRGFLSARRAVGRLDYLIGTERELRPLWQALQVLPSLDTGRDNLHSAPLRVYDRNGVWVATLHAGADLSEENLLHDIRTALAAGNETAG